MTDHSSQWQSVAATFVIRDGGYDLRSVSSGIVLSVPVTAFRKEGTLLASQGLTCYKTQHISDVHDTRKPAVLGPGLVYKVLNAHRGCLSPLGLWDARPFLSDHLAPPTPRGPVWHR